MLRSSRGRGKEKSLQTIIRKDFLFTVREAEQTKKKTFILELTVNFLKKIYRKQ